MLKRILNNSIALFVVVVVMFLFIPLNPMILDILLVVVLDLGVTGAALATILTVTTVVSLLIFFKVSGSKDVTM